MTNKEAIKILDNYYNGYFGYKIDDVIVAHQKAIEALENEPFLIDELDKAHAEIKEMERRIYEEGYSQGYIDGSTGADWEIEND